MKPGKEPDKWGGSVWEEKTPEESKREDGLENLVKKVSSFFYESESFIKVFEDFVERNAHKIDLDVEEMKLEYTDLYDEYQALFEKKIEGAGGEKEEASASFDRERKLPYYISSRLKDTNNLTQYPITDTSRPMFLQKSISVPGFTVGDFFERLREALERDPWSHEAVFAKIMTATADFDIFMNMMREAAEALPSKTSRKGREMDGEPAGEEKCERQHPRK